VEDPARSNRDRMNSAGRSALRSPLHKITRTNHEQKRQNPDAEPEKLTNKEYMKELRKLQAELCHLQEWVKHKGLRVIIIFEGRDAAGKGGTIRALTERVSPRVFSHRRLAGAVRSREVADVYAALHGALPGGG
jgi:polyphosphate kinase 2 (PPK2 family)